MSPKQRNASAPQLPPTAVAFSVPPQPLPPLPSSRAGCLGSTTRQPPSERLNIAGVGVGGMGHHNLQACSAENIVALCDIDQVYAAKSYKDFPKARKYLDFREMLDKQKDIQAVIVATPDHTHAVVALAAMRAGKHVYVQKPLSHSVYEARVLTEAARKHKVATQMGNQGHSGPGIRLVCEWIWAGAIGAVREVHAWTNRPVWPQGVEVGRPQETPPVPATSGLGSLAGAGALPALSSHVSAGDLAGVVGFRHRLVGRLGLPRLGPRVLGDEAQVSPERRGLHLHLLGRTLEAYQAEERNLSPFDHRALQVPRARRHAGHGPHLVGRRPDAAAAGESWKKGGRWAIPTAACSSSATRGCLMAGCYGKSPRLIPETKMKEFTLPPQTIPRIPKGLDGHEKDWVRACKGGVPASSNFDYSGPLSEMVLMGNLAVRFPTGGCFGTARRWK